ncbi:hypothetical protein MNEG_9350 [Monoraphidium neglectum]|uniref:Uncharacterized protein n=1 Tax=Monoraphidium neglectum TaxID=145388 RepID=A0A0D2JGU3_9CHLO|nr:hypothetical protein MNEG_9350 [Monoraphidium neglectum]KIY98612.1 hypothetical protein MNEG_9350 [Monoraphidium neglectum]|eukprot:XP_013897632.1 hypothetical protein MNEG_9350 [Monoraphidium neglectum]
MNLSHSSTSKRDYPECVVKFWDLRADTPQILQHLTDKCRDITLQGNPCSNWCQQRALYSEADCNFMFQCRFADPVAEMVTAVTGSQVTSSLEVLDYSGWAVPDFGFRGLGGQVLLVGEGKGMTYGFLTYLNGTYFIKRTGHHQYAFTRAIMSFDKEPTVLEMLMCAGGASGGHQAGSREQPHAKSALEFTNERLGFYGQPAAIKAIDVSKQGHLLPKMQAEVAIYDRLRSLQGVSIPILYGSGFWNYANTYFVATSVISGQHPSRSTFGGIQAAEQALRGIHACGVLHGDIRAENVFVAEEGGRWKVWLIDFDYSTESRDPGAQAAELAELQALFRPSNADTSTTSGLEPVDVILLLAATENDDPKIEELLAAGANVNVKDNLGRRPRDLATKDVVIKMLDAAEGKLVQA